MAVTKGWRRYWVSTAHQSYVNAMVRDGYLQVKHGRQLPLLRLARGDWVVLFSPMTAPNRTPLPQCAGKRVKPASEHVQAFTALGRITGDKPYMALDVPSSFYPWRRRAEFLPKAQPVYMKTLIQKLDFVLDKQRYGVSFRREIFDIEKSDFNLIAKAMQVTKELDELRDELWTEPDSGPVVF